MGLLSNLREFLRRLQTGRTHMIAERSGIDIDKARRIVIMACAHDAKRDHTMRMHYSQRHNLLENTDEFIFEIMQCIAERLHLSGDELAAITQHAVAATLDIHARLDMEHENSNNSTSAPQQVIMHYCCAKAWSEFEDRCSRKLPSPREYALELGLVEMAGNRPKISKVGEQFLLRSGNEAVQWIVAREIDSSLDRDDPWRGHASVADVVRVRGKLEAYDHEFQYDTGWPWNNPVLARWADIGILMKKRWERGEEPDGGISYEFTNLGSKILADVLWSNGSTEVPYGLSTTTNEEVAGLTDSLIRFRFKNLVGKGGWAEVWRAEDLRLRRDVAIKLFEPGGTHIASAGNHAQALARVSHPNVVGIYDVCTLPHPQHREPWNAIIMEILDGPTLSAVSVDDLRRFGVAQICLGIIGGLRALHDAGIVHSDIHSENILIHNGAPKILDALYRGTLAMCSGTAKQNLISRDLQQATSEIAMLITNSSTPELALKFRNLAKEAETAAALADILKALFEAESLRLMQE